MKRIGIRVIILALLINILAANIVLANAGPTYWQGYPASEILVVDENSPIKVIRENLVFDLRDIDRLDFAIHGQVTATYEMLNTSSNSQSVQMAFPLVSTINNLYNSDIIVQVDGVDIPFDVYAGDDVSTFGNRFNGSIDEQFSFDNIVKGITNKKYQAKNFAKGQKGTLYKIIVQSTTEDRVNFAIDLEYDSEKTKILADGFNSYGGRESKVTLGSRVSEPKELEVFVLGDPVQLEVSADIDGKQKQEGDFNLYEIIEQEVELVPYLISLMEKYQTVNYRHQDDNTNMSSELWKQQLYNVYAENIDRVLTQNNGFAMSRELLDVNNYKRIFTIVYTVEFPAEESKYVSVSYKVASTMDQTQTEKPMYRFDYLLNPAKKWLEFENLQIEIYTPEEASFIVESSIALVKQNDRFYKAHLDTLPNHDFYFIIYEDKELAFKNTAYGAIKNSSGYLIPGFVIMVAIFVVFSIYKRMNRRDLRVNKK
ncbi:hypothetical protein [Desulfuribacillus alkaliarsenatis]|uniref:Uncharacterized protein n=1 Tax=Desulfuribacillus alkaliarsenatis TaxID=766136 RepID=A0A1E5FYM3_9FIRM|nr:hypothetical protein [Desulfuribacillus alkaliarsenatis]OEF95672.1 hypothetical protein BHF68_11230 [Desulfuribacillus alkaliarsenatis]